MSLTVTPLPTDDMPGDKAMASLGDSHATNRRQPIIWFMATMPPGAETLPLTDTELFVVLFELFVLFVLFALLVSLAALLLLLLVQPTAKRKTIKTSNTGTNNRLIRIIA